MRQVWLTLRKWWPDGRAGRELLQTLVFSRLALILAGWVGLAELTWQYTSPTFNTSQNPLVLMWIRWDAIWYTGIAAHGYWGQALAFFPLYPLLIAAVHGVSRLSFNWSAILVSNAAMVLFAVTFYRLVRETFAERLARRAVWIAFIFPTAFFMSAGYTESLFLWLTTASFLAARRHNFWWAGVYGFFAALTRNEGVFVAIPFLWAYYHQYRYRITRKLLPLFLIPLAIALFMVYQWRDFGNPLGFMAAQSDWGRHITWPWIGIFLSIGTIWQGGPLQPDTILSMIDLVAALGSLALWVYGLRRRMPMDWLVYWAILWLIDVAAPDPGGQSPLLSMSRLVLALFPNFVALGILARNSAWRRMLQWVLPALQVVFFVIFATWHWIA